MENEPTETSPMINLNLVTPQEEEAWEELEKRQAQREEREELDRIDRERSGTDGIR